MHSHHKMKGSKTFFFSSKVESFSCLSPKCRVRERESGGENCVSAQEHLIKKFVQTLMMFSEEVFRGAPLPRFSHAVALYTCCCCCFIYVSLFLAPAGGVHLQGARLTIICIRRFAHGIFKLHASERLLFRAKCSSLRPPLTC